MTAQVFTDFFVHEHNRREVVEQEYEAAKAHYDEVLLQDWTSDDAQKRFRAASDRLSAARERWRELLCE
jgi:hypothetical protein